MMNTHSESLFEVLAEFVQQRDALFQSRPSLSELIKQKAIRKGNFTLASGRHSDYFFDLKPVMLDPIGSNLIAEGVLSHLKMLNAHHRIDAIGGLAIGAVPIIATVVARSWSEEMPIPGFYVRKQVKDHGTERLIDGMDVTGKRVVLIEDVTTTSGSLLQAVDAVQRAGGTVLDAITVVDRKEGGYQNLYARGIHLTALHSLEEFTDAEG